MCIRDRYGSAPQIEAIHAGVECGILAGKLPGLDCVSVGPDLLDIHTPRERMDIEMCIRDRPGPGVQSDDGDFLFFHKAASN